MAEPVRLVVWDLDETFWRGTLVEGGIREYVQAHHEIVVELAQRGILSSICSKNDEPSVLHILGERKILDYFVFPDISWDPKGPRLAALIEAVQLRPASVMFIDDNPRNLAEAKALIPGLQLENETFIPKLLADPRFVGKDDSGLSRLKQYKLLEARREAQRSADGGGHQFLRDSDIRVCFDHDLEDVANLDRAIELINRTNQLNYTKRRLPEDLEAARGILRRDTARMEVQAGLIRVVDKYGDYGYVGFFMMRVNMQAHESAHRELLHFCFSCRTLGMLVERWVFDYLERPKLEVVGEVLTDLSGPDAVDWVRLVSSSELFSDRKAEVAAIAPELRLYGGCEMYPIGLYLKQYAPEVKVRGSFVANNKFILLNSCALALSAFDRTESEFSEEAKALGVPADVLAGDYFADAPPGTAIVFSGALDAGRFSDYQPYYQHAHHGWELAFELANCWDVTTLPEGAFERLVEEREGYDERTRLHLTEVARHVRRNYRTAPPMSDGRRAATLRALLEHVPVGAKLILLLDHDRHRVQGVVQPEPRTAHYNELVRSIMRAYPYAEAVCFSDFVDDDEQVQELGNHYHRVVYLKLAERLAELIERLPRKCASDVRGQEIVDAEATVRGLYKHLLGHTPSENELKAWSWCAYARKGLTVPDLVEHFVSSEDYKSRLRAAPDAQRIPGLSPAAAEEYIASLYATILKREPTPEEFAHWVTTATAFPPEQLYFAFVNSQEYKRRARSVDILQTQHPQTGVTGGPHVGSDPIDISTYLFPNELQVTNVPLKKMLLTGSCMSVIYRGRFRGIDPELEVDHIFVNNLQQLPALTTAQLDTYQLQYVQLPLREVLTDRIVRICDIDRAAGFGEILDDARAKLAAMLDAAMAYNKQHGLLTLVANFFVPQGHAAPSLAGLGGEGDLIALIAELNRTLAHLVPKYQNAYVADVNSLANSYGKRNFFDDIIYFYSHGTVAFAAEAPGIGGAEWAQHDNWPIWSAPHCARVELVPDPVELYQLQPEPFFKLVLDQIRYLHRVAQQVDQVKIVIFDLDNTLWRGQIAEHYETGREWPDMYNWPPGIWETVQHLRRRGILVSLCSKNDESLVRDRWSRAVQLPWISLDDFTAPKINWNRKSENVRTILSELNLTSKSALFVDDSPVERSEVLSGVPGIRAIGGNPFVTRRILLWSAETQRSVMTDESTNRETSYRGILARNAEMESMDRESFLQSLQIRIQLHHITEIDSPLLPRVLELANKTTQFNTTGLKWTPPELTTFIENRGAIFAFSVQDKFADYGLVGAVFVSESVVRQFVMSCRVVGNDVEVNALKQILKLVRDQDEGPSILGRIIPNEVNGPCHDIYLRSGFQETETPNTFAILKAAL